MTEQRSEFPADRRIVILADFLPPDFGAVGQYMLLRARTSARQGHRVALFGLSTVAASIEQVTVGDGALSIHRLRAREVPRGSLAARAMWTFITNLRLIWAALPDLRRADLVFVTGSPPFLFHFLAPLRKFCRGRIVHRITDFHPECLIAARERPSAFLNLLQALTDRWRRRIDAFEVLGEDQRRHLVGKGIADDRIVLVRDASPVEFTPSRPPRKLPAELQSHCVLLYSGNFGVAHDFRTVADGYRLHHRQGTGRVRLWLNATGEGAGRLNDELFESELPFFRSAPVPLDELPALLLSPHAHLISLKDAFVGFVMPSKVYACLESGKPLIFVGSTRSDVHLLAQDRIQQGYWQVDCGDAAGFAGALEALADRSGVPRPSQ